jgi:hypothetical protein
MSSSTMRNTGAALLAMVAVAACSDSGGPSLSGNQVALQLATQPATAPAVRGAALVAGQEILAAGSDTIVVTGVQMVLRQIELNRVGGSACDSLNPGGDSCEELEFGPVLLDLPLGAGAARQFSVAVDTGSYDKIEFQVHKPESSDDAAFIAQNPAFDGVSIRMTGTYNGTAFTYTSDLDVEQEHDIAPPLAVTGTAGAQLTLMVDLQQWFLIQGGTGLIDPATANKGGQYEGEVKSNIETSLNAFEDSNHDGMSDN